MAYDYSLSGPLSFNGTGTQDFRTSFAGPPPGQESDFGARARAHIARAAAAGSQTAQAYQNLPQTLNVNQFNAVAQSDPGHAYDMLGAGGQDYRNAVMQANGWSPLQMNQFINQSQRLRDGTGFNGHGYAPEGFMSGNRDPNMNTGGTGEMYSVDGSWSPGAPKQPVNGGSTMPGQEPTGDQFGGPDFGGDWFGAGSSQPQGNTTLGSLAGGMQMPGGQPNYPLDVGSYLNPMLGYGLQQGMQTINNSAAARGSLQSGDTLKELFGYGMGQGMDAFNKAAGIGQQQQGFAYGVDKNDRDFNYNSQVGDRDFAYRAATGDRDFNFQRAMGQAGLGLSSQQIAANQSSEMARLLATLGLGGAQAAGAGATNTGRTANAGVQQLINLLLGGGRG